jgi:hypothetical protein
VINESDREGNSFAVLFGLYAEKNLMFSGSGLPLPSTFVDKKQHPSQSVIQEGVKR